MKKNLIKNLNFTKTGDPRVSCFFMFSPYGILKLF